MKKKKVLILGASGMLGVEVLREFSKKIFYYMQLYDHKKKLKESKLILITK